MRNTSTSTVGSILAAVVDEFTDRLQHGEPVDVEAYARAHPHLADLLREVLPPILGLRGQGHVILPLVRSPSLSLPRIEGYEVLEELGRGGMGVVYKARHLALDRVVAVKVLRTDRAHDSASRDRFLAEARAVARLRHPGIVQIFEVGQADEMVYFTLELIEGGSLADATAGQPQAPQRVATLVERLAVALQVAHEHGLIHRDLKPSNVLLAPDDTPKITDFGLVKQVDAESGLTQTGAIVGTPSYMAPEQAAGRPDLTSAADIHALGAILYELITGRSPFKGRRCSKL